MLYPHFPFKYSSLDIICSVLELSLSLSVEKFLVCFGETASLAMAYDRDFDPFYLILRIFKTVGLWIPEKPTVWTTLYTTVMYIIVIIMPGT